MNTVFQSVTCRKCGGAHLSAKGQSWSAVEAIPPKPKDERSEANEIMAVLRSFAAVLGSTAYDARTHKGDTSSSQVDHARARKVIERNLCFSISERHKPIAPHPMHDDRVNKPADQDWVHNIWQKASTSGNSSYRTHGSVIGVWTPYSNCIISPFIALSLNFLTFLNLQKFNFMFF